VRNIGNAGGEKRCHIVGSKFHFLFVLELNQTTLLW